MKKTVYMVAGSLLLFFVFAYIDEYETLILPLLKEDAPSAKIEMSSDFAAENLVGFLKEFNAQLSSAYAASNPGKAWELPATAEVQRSIHDELVYNLTNNISIESKVADLLILRIDSISPTSNRVVVLETMDSGKNVSSRAAVAYIIVKSEKGLVVAGMESVERGENRRGSTK
jgi:hypothetical protein